MNIEQAVGVLEKHGFVLDQEKPIQHGTQLVFRNGAKVSVYHTGKINIQGKHFDVVSELLGQAAPERTTVGRSNVADDEF